MCVVAAGRRTLCPFLFSSIVCCRVQYGELPLHYAARWNVSEAVVKAVLAAYPDAIKEKDNALWLRAARVVPSLLTCVAVCSMGSRRSTWPLRATRRAVDEGAAHAYPDAIKADEQWACVRATCVEQSSLALVCCRRSPLDLAASSNRRRRWMKPLLDAYSDAIKEKRIKGCGRGRRVLCPSLSSLVCFAVCRMGACRSTRPLGGTRRRRRVKACARRLPGRGQGEG